MQRARECASGNFEFICVAIVPGWDPAGHTVPATCYETLGRRFPSSTLAMGPGEGVGDGACQSVCGPGSAPINAADAVPLACSVTEHRRHSALLTKSRTTFKKTAI